MSSNKHKYGSIEQCIDAITEMTVQNLEYRRLLHQAENGTGVFKDSSLKQRWNFKITIREKIEECEKDIETATNVAVTM